MLTTAEKILELGNVTELSNNIVVPKLDWATTTSDPNIKFINCCVKILIPNVAKIEINKSLSTTLLITNLYKPTPTKYIMIGETITPKAGWIPTMYIK